MPGILKAILAGAVLACRVLLVFTNVWSSAAMLCQGYSKPYWLVQCSPAGPSFCRKIVMRLLLQLSHRESLSVLVACTCASQHVEAQIHRLFDTHHDSRSERPPTWPRKPAGQAAAAGTGAYMVFREGKVWDFPAGRNAVRSRIH